jgi:modulator of FtsH protease
MTIHDWSDFYVAAAGAGAALAGLIIVAMSVNIKTIIDIPGMTSRGATTIASLVLIVIVSFVGLIPVQPLYAYGLENAAAAVVTLVFAVRSARVILTGDAEDPRQTKDTRGGAVLKSLLGIVPVSLVLTGSLLAVFSVPAGLGVVAAGILACVAASSTNAWVLLVEILR